MYDSFHFFYRLKTIKCVYFSIRIFLERFFLLFIIIIFFSSKIDTSDFVMSLFKWAHNNNQNGKR